MKKFLVSLLAMALAFSQPVFAQQAPTSGPASILSGQVTLAVSSVNARVALPSTAVSANTVTIYNKGTVDAFVALGDVTATATSGGTCVSGALGPSCQVPAGTAITLWRNDATYVAAITASSTTNLVIYQGTGPIQLSRVGIPSGGSPGGAAGGDLFGIYPNPSVASYNGGTVFGTAAAASLGTSGATVPLLNGANTWSGTQAFGSGVLSATSPTFTTPVLGAATGTSLALTGTLSTTGAIIAGAAQQIYWSTRTTLQAPSNGALQVGDNALTNSFTITAGASNLATFNGPIAINNTVNAVSPTSPNRTVTMVIGGTTYYLAAKTTND